MSSKCEKHASKTKCKNAACACKHHCCHKNVSELSKKCEMLLDQMSKNDEKIKNEKNPQNKKEIEKENEALEIEYQKTQTLISNTESKFSVMPTFDDEIVVAEEDYECNSD